MQKQHVTEKFIGRTGEIDLFKHWLAETGDRRILYIHDALEDADKKGGIGKTWLLSKFVNLVQQEQQDIHALIIDLFNIAERGRIAIAEHVVAGLQELCPDWSPTSFNAAVEQYREGEYQAPITYDSTDAKNIQTREVLSIAMEADLKRLDAYFEQQQKTLLVLFDTFEVIEQNPSIAVLSPSRLFPDTYHFEHIRFVVAGRNKLDWTHPNWQGREEAVHEIALAPFNLQETLGYINIESSYNTPQDITQATALYERTEGRPILIGLAIDVLNHRILTPAELIHTPPNDFERYLVTRINQLENPLNWVILFMAHVYHRFTIPLLDWILSEQQLRELIKSDIEYQTSLATLPQLSFVRHSSDSDEFVLHDEMRRLVIKYCWDVQDPDQRFRKAISQRIISYNEQRLASATNEQEKQAYIIEILYHSLFINLTDNLAYFQKQFDQALILGKSSFARLLYQEVQNFIGRMSLAQKCDFLVSEARLLRAEDSVNAALSIYQILYQEADSQWLEEHRLNLLRQHARCYLQLGMFTEALDCYEQGFAIAKAQDDEESRASILANLGYIYRRRGQLQRAQQCYEECAAIYKKLKYRRSYAEALNNLGNIYRFKGETEEALRHCKIAWRIIYDLLQKGTISEVPLGNNLSTIGAIYLDADDILNAEQFYRSALDIYNRAGYKQGLASVYNRLGQIEMARDKLEQANEFFERAQAISFEVNLELYLNSLNLQGQVRVSQKKWQEAGYFFEQAVKSARQVHDDYQLTKNLIDFADACQYMGQQELADRIWQEAEAIALQENNHYFYLLGKAEKARAEFYYGKGQYATAFAYFASYCHYMAQHNMLEYTTAVRKAMDALYGVPESEVSTMADILIRYWQTHQLDDKYPELVKVSNEVKDLIIL
jgi:tetratricopeptide (TPR) repeat protein